MSLETEFRVVFSARALKQLKKIDKPTASLIIGWLRKNIEGCSDPRQHGKGLTANRSGQWRYRVGAYRMITEIQDDKVIVLALEVGHRKNIY
ncbi:MAG: type II toxin-antitoxin system RelE/ParE family toxin [Lachnospiraceae bacterium]|nr:type II toxin-antitoxin system RelE/ParE family toxin [Lachnospiraceae bacterium]MDY5742288.1 type II toxin-antitoxin system RelE/ParE family toxin [Lachnospiraceae bacterium]